MGVLLSLPITILNLLLPFTKANTPLVKDLIHTAILCGTLYFAPQIAEWYAQRTQETIEGAHPPEATEVGHNNELPQADEPPLDDRFVLQDEDEDGAGPPPPLAPTPPPFPPNQPPAPLVQDNFPDFAPPQPRPARPRATPANRTIGAKKAKSLAKKDQRRAYHEFHRQEAELRRLQEQEGLEEREATANAERERRAQIEDEIRDKERQERERRKEEERREAEEENARRERTVSRVRDGVKARGAVNLVDEAWKEGKDMVWVERLVRASGLLGQLQKDGAHVLITGHGWLVRVDAELMQQTYADAERFGNANGGTVSFTEFGGLLEKAVLARAKA